MTAAYVATPPACPKCGGACWDQKSSKFWGNGLTKNGKAKPRYECKNKDCGGAIWEPKTTITVTPAAVTSHPMASKPDSQLPPLLRNQQEVQDAAELAGKIGFDIKQIETTLSVYQGVYEWYLNNIVPLATKADIGASPESVNAGVATILIQATKPILIQATKK